MTDSGSPVPPASSGAAPSGPPPKVREPVTVVLLSIVTLGIYFLWWSYTVFTELKDHNGEGIGGPIGLLLAFCIGIVNAFLLPSEIEKMYQREGVTSPVTAMTGFWVFLPIVGGIIWIVKMQNALNDRWIAAGATPA